ncbi:PilW family protein [Thiolapillus sp.]
MIKHVSTHRQYGFSLLSLMVAMAIGIFLIGAIIKIYLDTKDSFNTRNVVAEVSENTRFALDDMRRILVMAGRGIRAIEDQFPNRRPFPDINSSGIVDGGASDSDTIAIRYRRGPSCGAYQDVGVGTRPSMVRFYVTDNSGDGSADDLVCELTTYGGGATTVTRTLVSGVQRLKALYGVDDNADGYADRYLTPTAIGTAASPGIPVPSGANTPWAKVVSIRIGLMTGSESTLPKAVADQTTNSTLNVLGLSIPKPDTDHLYRVTTTTLALRNLNPVIQRQ